MPICVSRGLSSFHRKRAYINSFCRDRLLNNRTRILSFIERRGRFSLCLFLCILEHSASVTLDYTHLLDERLTRTYSKDRFSSAESRVNSVYGMNVGQRSFSLFYQLY